MRITCLMIGVFASLLAPVGCASSPNARATHVETGYSVLPRSTNLATVVFVGTSRNNTQVLILDDRGRFQTEVWSNAYSAIQVDPGEHVFLAWAENTSILRATVVAGRVYYVEVATDGIGGWWGGAMDLRPISTRRADLLSPLGRRYCVSLPTRSPVSFRPTATFVVSDVRFVGRDERAAEQEGWLANGTLTVRPKALTEQVIPIEVSTEGGPYNPKGYFYVECTADPGVIRKWVEEWMAPLKHLITSQITGQAYLDSHPEQVQDQIQKGKQRLAAYELQRVEQHTLGAEDGLP